MMLPTSLQTQTITKTPIVRNKQHTKNNWITKPVMIDAGCQTVAAAEQATMTEVHEPLQDHTQTAEISILHTTKNREKELAFLIQLFSSISTNDSISKKCSEISQAYDKQYNVKVDKSKVHSYYQSLSSKLQKTSSQGNGHHRTSSQSSTNKNSSSQGSGVIAKQTSQNSKPQQQQPSTQNSGSNDQNDHGQQRQ
jgi:hypothetical protein